MKLLSLRIGFGLLLLAHFALNGIAQSGIIETYAGPQLPADGAQATTQTIDRVSAVAPDGMGGFFVASPHQNRIYRVASDGSLSLIAGSGTSGYGGDGGLATAAQLNWPHDVAADAAGNLYIADTYNHRIRKVTAEGLISTVAGNGTAGYSGDGGLATVAQLNYPYAVAADAAGNIYVADSLNDRIRKVTAGGVISTVAGNGTGGFSGDGGLATAALMFEPEGVAVDAGGNLYIADSGNERIRRVTTGGVISTVAGNGTAGYSGDGGLATAAHLGYPEDVAVDAAGSLYISDHYNYRIRRVTAGGVISTVAGNGTRGFSGDGGPATAAQLYGPEGVAVDTAGNIYIADIYNSRIRKVTAGGVISTVAGNGTGGFSGDGGPATAAQLFNPTSMVVDAVGNLYFADIYNNRIRKVTAEGVIGTVAGNGTGGFSGDGGPATVAQLDGPFGVAVDAAGNIYIADTNNDRIRKVTAEGVISTVAGNGIGGYSGDGGPATAAQFDSPRGVAVDDAGSLYIADAGNYRIRKVTAGGVISTVAGGGTLEPESADGGPATAARVIWPAGVAVDAKGNLYIADYSHQRIRKVTAEGIISTVAGNGAWGYSGDGGLATAAQLNGPFGVAVDAAGNIYIADTYNDRIRKVSPEGVISTVAGNGTEGFSGDGGLATAAQLFYPFGVAIGAAGSLYIADSGNERIRIVADALPPIVTTAMIRSITKTAASGGGNVTSDGGALVTARGVCWSTSANPTTANACTSDGDGIGTYASSMTGLVVGTTYHVRAYAINSVGTAYGADAAFTTLGRPDFQVSTGPGGSYSIAVTAGSSAAYNLVVTGIDGFSGSINFICSGLPRATTCSVSPTPLSVSGSEAVPFTVTITTTAHTITASMITDPARLPWSRPAPAAFLGLSSMIPLLCMPRRRRLSIAILLLSAAGLSGCGGSSGGISLPTSPTTQDTPAGTYAIVVTATSGSISHNTNLTLTVN